MNIGENKSGSFVLSQCLPIHRAEAGPSRFAPGITISHQTGSGAHEIAERAAKILDRIERNSPAVWKIYDRQLIEKVLEDHLLPRQIARHVPEDRRSTIQDVTEELLGLRPPSWVLIPMIAETIRRLIQAGRVILIGRGAAVIASSMPGVFHVRLIASLAGRIERVRQIEHLNRNEAVHFIEREDRGFRRYVRSYFHTEVEDPLLYHLVINTERVPYDEAAMLIADGARRSFNDSNSLQPEHQAG
jgi:hypothetical protein